MQYGCGFVFNEHLLTIYKISIHFGAVKGLRRLFDGKKALKKSLDESQKQ
jgi:hypothetical protein